jgi:hypothetical protein
MNMYVLMIACVSRARGWNHSPPRWSARRRRCSPSYSRTPHETARPSHAGQASSTRNRPHMARADRVSGLPLPLPAFLPLFLSSRLRNESPSPAETAANEHYRDNQTAPDKGCVAKSVKPRARDAARRRDLPVYLPFRLPFHLPIRTEHPVSTELAANAHNQASATAPDKEANYKVDRDTPAGGSEARCGTQYACADAGCLWLAQGL